MYDINTTTRLHIFKYNNICLVFQHQMLDYDLTFFITKIYAKFLKRKTVGRN